MNALVVVSSSDAEFYLLASHILVAEGYDCVLATRPDEVLDLALHKSPFAVILDCRADNSGGSVEVCARLKGDPATARILSVAIIEQSAGNQHIELLKAGADANCVRPFAPLRLLEFLQARLPRAPLEKASPGNLLLLYADIEMNLTTRRVQRSGTFIHLPFIEFNILRYFLERPEQVIGREELIKGVWPPNHFADPRTVDVHVGRLRRLLKGKDGSDLVRTVRGSGYSIDIRQDDP